MIFKIQDFISSYLWTCIIVYSYNYFRCMKPEQHSFKKQNSKISDPLHDFETVHCSLFRPSNLNYLRCAERQSPDFLGFKTLVIIQDGISRFINRFYRHVAEMLQQLLSTTWILKLNWSKSVNSPMTYNIVNLPFLVTIFFLPSSNNPKNNKKIIPCFSVTCSKRACNFSYFSPITGVRLFTDCPPVGYRKELTFCWS